jgi:uncharacterized protein
MSEDPGRVDEPSRPRRPTARQGSVAAAVLLAAAALAVTLARGEASATAGSAGCDGSAPHLTVQGTGRSTGRPNLLEFQAQVSVTAPTAAAALTQDSQTSSAVVSAIEAAGVRVADVSTTDLTVNPDYSYADGQEQITDYMASNSIAVTVRRLGIAGSVIDAASNAGGDALSISSLDFTRADPRILEDQARTNAVRQAVTHAASMARAAGERLAGVCSLSDQSTLVPIGPQFAGRSLAAAPPGVPLEGGTQQATAQVSLVYALVPLNP